MARLGCVNASSTRGWEGVRVWNTLIKISVNHSEWDPSIMCSCLPDHNLVNTAGDTADE